MSGNIRLDKYLSDCTNLSRKESKSCISKGHVSIDGKKVIKSDEKVCLKTQQVYLDGKVLLYEKEVYYLLNKPAGVVSATKDNYDTTVVELVKEEAKDLFPVGRLDKDTEGLCILTNDGVLAHKLLSPKYHVEKQYYTKVDKKLSEDDITMFANGIDIGEGYLTKPAVLEILSDTAAYVTITEGKFHQVKRMFQKVGKKVIYLKRIRMGSLILDEDLKVGEYRRLTSEEQELLWQKRNITQ